MLNNCNRIMPVIPRQCVVIQGKDAESFLHAMCSSRIKGLPPEKCGVTSLCSPAGRVMADGVIWHDGNCWYWLTNDQIAASLEEILTRHKLRADVEIRLDDAPCMGLAGKDAEVFLDKYNIAPHEKEGVVTKDGITVVRRTDGRYVLMGMPAEKIVNEAIREGFQSQGPDVWQWLDIMLGWPTIFPDTQDTFIPQQINLDLLGAIDFEKGCFPGQEVIARVRYLGKNTKRMFLYHQDELSLLSPGDPVYRGEMVVGKVVDVRANPVSGGMNSLVIVNPEEAEKPGLTTIGGMLTGPIPLPYSIREKAE